MIPSRTWLPQSLQERAAWYQNFATQFGPIATILGFLPAQVTAVNADRDDLVFCASATVEIDAYKDAFRQYRITLTEGDIGSPTANFPQNPSLNPPSQVATGIFERLDNLVKRIRVAPTYTNEIGALLGIMPSTPTGVPEAEMKPVIKASESFSLYKFSVNVTRMGMTAFKVQIQRSGSATWQDAAFATNNPAEITVTPTTPGQPERILVRSILLEKNEPVGIPSDPTFVTVNP